MGDISQFPGVFAASPDQLMPFAKCATHALCHSGDVAVQLPDRVMVVVGKIYREIRATRSRYVIEIKRRLSLSLS
jgi:hypothetical protein